MPTFVSSFLPLLQPFQSQMTDPTFASLLTVLAGWVLSRRRHTVTGARVEDGALQVRFRFEQEEQP